MEVSKFKHKGCLLVDFKQTQCYIEILLFSILLSMLGACHTKEPTPKKEQVTQEERGALEEQYETITDSMKQQLRYCSWVQMNGSSCFNDPPKPGIRLSVNFLSLNYVYTILPLPHHDYKVTFEKKMYYRPGNYLAESYYKKLDFVQVMTDLNSVHFESYQEPEGFSIDDRSFFYLETMYNGKYSLKKGLVREEETNEVNPIFRYILNSFRLDSTEYKWALGPDMPTLKYRDRSE